MVIKRERKLESGLHNIRVREGLPKKVIFEQRPEPAKEPGYLGTDCSRLSSKQQQEH